GGMDPGGLTLCGASTGVPWTSVAGAGAGAGPAFTPMMRMGNNGPIVRAGGLSDRGGGTGDVRGTASALPPAAGGVRSPGAAVDSNASLAPSSSAILSPSPRFHRSALGPSPMKAGLGLRAGAPRLNRDGIRRFHRLSPPTLEARSRVHRLV